MPISEAELNAIRSHLIRSFQPGASQDATRELDQLITAIRELQPQVYIGEHEFPDLTWKSRCLEANADLNKCRDQLAALQQSVAVPSGDLVSREQCVAILSDARAEGYSDLRELISRVRALPAVSVPVPRESILAQGRSCE